MIQYIQISQPNGDSVSISLRSPEQSGFFIKNIEGLDPPNININVSESPNIDGGVYNSSRASQRNIVISLGFLNGTGESIETIRNKMYRYFPSKTELTLLIVTDTRVATTKGYIESNNINIFSKDQGATVSILCQDPFLYGEDEYTIFSGTKPTFVLPWSNNSLGTPLLSFGTIFQNIEANVLYTGDQSTGVVLIVDFIGPVTNPAFVNTSSSQTISISSTKVTSITGSNFIAGDRLYLSTKKGNKSIYLLRDGVVYNIINAIGSYSDWFTLTRGDNVFVYIADSGLTNMLVAVMHSNLYEGV